VNPWINPGAIENGKTVNPRINLGAIENGKTSFATALRPWLLGISANGISKIKINPVITLISSC